MDDADEPLPDPADPINLAHSLHATVYGLVEGYRQHEITAQIGDLAGRITEQDSELAEASRWLAWHGRRASDAEHDRPPAPFGRRFKPR